MKKLKIKLISHRLVIISLILSFIISGCFYKKEVSLKINPSVLPDKRFIDKKLCPESIFNSEILQKKLLLYCDKKKIPFEKFYLSNSPEINALVLNYILGEFASKIHISEKEMISYYNEHIDNYKIPDKYDVIVFFTPKRKDGINFISEVRNTRNKNVQEIAKKYSDVEEVLNGIVNSEKLPPELRSILHKLTPGKISGLIQVESGYYILKVKTIYRGSIIPYEKVKDNIKEIILKKHIELLIKRVIK